MIDFSLMVNEIAPKHFLPALVVFTASEMTRVGLVLPAAQPPTSDAEQLKQPCQSVSGPPEDWRGELERRWRKVLGEGDQTIWD
jgi:hypothetical protein